MQYGLATINLCWLRVVLLRNQSNAFAAPGRMVFAAIMAYLLLFTDRASTGLFIMFLCDFSFGLWLGMTVGFGGVSRGRMRDLTRKT